MKCPPQVNLITGGTLDKINVPQNGIIAKTNRAKVYIENALMMFL